MDCANGPGQQVFHSDKPTVKKEEGERDEAFKLGLAMFLVLAVAGLSLAGTLDDVKGKGYISVGVNESLFGFSKPDEKGVWRGLDVDTARAISVAVFGSPDKIKWVPLTAKTRFTALQSGEIDVLTRNATQTLSRETALGLNFVHVNYYDGQGFLIPKKLGVKSAKELDGGDGMRAAWNDDGTQCRRLFSCQRHDNETGGHRKYSRTGQGLLRRSVRLFDLRRLPIGRDPCDCSNPNDYMILPEIISREPLAPAVRHGDDQWYDIVNFATMAMMEAEFLGIDSKKRG